MATRFRYQLSKRTFWRDLPLVGFLAGSLVAVSSHWLSQRHSVTVEAWSVAGCTIVPSLKVAALLGCDQPLPKVLKRSLWHNALQELDQGLAFLQAAPNCQQLRYTATATPPFKTVTAAAVSPTLSEIVDGVMAQLAARDFPTAAVSVSLVDLTGDCCDYAGHQDLQPRYPASVVKLFWLVALYGHYDAGRLQPDVDVYADDETLMAHYSNNGASSRVVDALTQTESGEALDDAALMEWVQARQTLNDYFLLANYPNLNIAHKTFPIPDLGMETRTGRDQQFAEGAGSFESNRTLERNFLTTATTARLLYEIDTGQAVSPAYSARIKDHLRHSSDPEIWQQEEDNAIAGFFGEYLPPDTQLYTKLGFTFDDGRQEAAIIASADNQVRFILVLFANDSAYSYQDETVFPTVARYVYDQMRRRQALQTTE